MLRLTELASDGRGDPGERYEDRACGFDYQVNDMVSAQGVPLRRLPDLSLSAHELAAMLMLASTSIDVSASTPDIAALKAKGLAGVAQSVQGKRIVLKACGLAVLRRLEA